MKKLIPLLFSVFSVQFVPLYAFSSIAIDQVQPSLVPLNGDTLVTLSGAGFREDCVVNVGQSLCTDLRLIDGKTLMCRTPQQSVPGSISLSLQCPGEHQSAVSQLTYYAALSMNVPAQYEAQIPFQVKISGGVPPYSFYWDKIEENSLAGQTSDPAASVTSYQSGQHILFVVDSVHDQAYKIIDFSALFGIRYLPTAVIPNSTINIPPLAGVDGTDLKLLQGNASLLKQSDGSYRLAVGAGGQLVELSAHDLYTSIDAKLWVASSGYSDKAYPMLAETDGYNLRAIAVGEEAIIEAHEDGLGTFKIRSIDLSGKDLWVLSDPAKLGVKSRSILPTSLAVTSDQSIFVGGIASHESILSDYSFPFLVKLTSSGILDKSFACKTDYPHESRIHDLIARQDGGVWAILDFPLEPKDVDVRGRMVVLWDKAGKEMKRLALEDGITVARLALDGRDGVYVLKSGDKISPSIMHADRNMTFDTAFEATTKKTLSSLTSTILFNFTYDGARLYFVAQSGMYQQLLWNGASDQPQASVPVVLFSDGSFAPGAWPPDAVSIATDAQNRLLIYRSPRLNNLALQRYEPDGEMDLSFGFQGGTIDQFDYYDNGPEVLIERLIDGNPRMLEISEKHVVLEVE